MGYATILGQIGDGHAVFLGLSEVEVLEQLPDLLQRDEEHDGEGSLSRHRRNEALVQRQRALLSTDLPQLP